MVSSLCSSCRRKNFKWSEKEDVSIIDGVSSIVTAGSWHQKLIKVLILSLGLVGFLFQTRQFLELYWQYSTVELISRKTMIEKPAFTICDENIIRRRYFCENLPEKCTDFINKVSGTPVKHPTSEHFCAFFAPYCVDPDDIYTKVPTKHIVLYENESFFDLNFTRESGFQIGENLILCSWIHYDWSQQESHKVSVTPCRKPKFVRTMNQMKFPAACYTMGSKIGVSSYVTENLKRNSVLRISMKWKTSDFNNVRSKLTSMTNVVPRAYYLSFHPPGQMSNPFIDGIRIEDRKHYTIQVSETDFFRLPAPYSTQCRDYRKEWMENGGIGPLNKEDCRRSCQIAETLKAYGCVPMGISYPHEHQLCGLTKEYDEILKGRMQNCEEKCKEACFESKFSARSSIADKMTYEESDTQKKSVIVLPMSNDCWSVRFKTRKTLFNASSAVTMEIYFNSLNSKISEERPKYEEIEVFSYIGGYLGMWLGWSLIALCDFFEILFRVSLYLFFMNRKRKMETVVKPCHSH